MPSRKHDFSTVNVGSDYEPDEFEFMLAVEHYRRERHRPFPTCREILNVAKSLGYRLVAPRAPLPQPPWEDALPPQASSVV